MGEHVRPFAGQPSAASQADRTLMVEPDSAQPAWRTARAACPESVRDRPGAAGVTPPWPCDGSGGIRRQQRYVQLHIVRIDSHVGDRLAHDRLLSSAALTPRSVSTRES